MNGATCIDGINSYQCQCTSGFDGKYCHVPIGICYGVNTATRIGVTSSTGNLVFTKRTSFSGLIYGRYGNDTNI
jgi:Notch-like protein